VYEAMKSSFRVRFRTITKFGGAAGAVERMKLLTLLNKKASFIAAICTNSENNSTENIPVNVIPPAQLKGLEEVARLLRFESMNRLLESSCSGELSQALHDDKPRWPLTEDTPADIRSLRRREASFIKRAPVRLPFTPVASSQQPALTPSSQQRPFTLSALGGQANTPSLATPAQRGSGDATPAAAAAAQFASTIKTPPPGNASTSSEQVCDSGCDW
jgi:hypothetical protein